LPARRGWGPLGGCRAGGGVGAQPCFFFLPPGPRVAILGEEGVGGGGEAPPPVRGGRQRVGGYRSGGKNTGEESQTSVQHQECSPGIGSDSVIWAISRGKPRWILTCPTSKSVCRMVATR